MIQIFEADPQIISKPSLEQLKQEALKDEERGDKRFKGNEILRLFYYLDYTLGF